MPTTPQPAPKSKPVTLPVTSHRYIFAYNPVTDDNKPRTFLEMAGCVRCSLYFASRRDRKRHSKSAHASDPLPKYEAPAKDASLKYTAADPTALETLRHCSCLGCGFFYVTSALRAKHASSCRSKHPDSPLEDGLTRDLMPAIMPKKVLNCPECDHDYNTESTKASHNITRHGIRWNCSLSSDDESESEGKSGPGYESIFQLFGWFNEYYIYIPHCDLALLYNVK